MFRAVSMRKLRIFILERHVQNVTRALGEMGVLHLRNSVEEGGGELRPERKRDDIRAAEQLLNCLRELADRLGVDRTPVPARAAGLLPEPAQASDLYKEVQGAASGSLAALEEAQERLNEAQELADRLAPFRDVNAPLSSLVDSDLIDVRACRANPLQEKALRESTPDGVLLAPLAGDGAAPGGGPNLLVISGRRQRFAAETVLQDLGLQGVPIPDYAESTPHDVYQEALARIERFSAQVDRLRASVAAVGERYAERLRQACADLELQVQLLQARASFGATWATAVISGWAPTAMVDEIVRKVEETTDGQAVVQKEVPTRQEITDGEVPVCLSHSKLLAPFERLVQGYGVATYTEVEPTLLFAVTFLLMFGIMFGDLGHGLCLIGIALLVKRRAETGAFRDIGSVMLYCGVASALFGTFVEGSFFGKRLTDMGFPFTLGFEPMRLEEGATDNVIHYLLLALFFGVAVVSLGMVLNVVNRLRQGDFENGLLGGFGVAGIVLYWGALALILKVVLVGAGPWDGWIALVVLGLPLLAVIFREPLYALFTGRRPLWQDGPGVGVFEGLIEALELGTAYVANTFSFLRVAAFALTHAGLMFATFVLYDLVGDLPGGFLWSAVVFLLGTALILGLEGLIVAIQILRLEYYEFFTKFFRGEGKPYSPFRLTREKID